ncbi:hypothetical protein FKM82_004357 [Ascaphus truei]
MLFQWIQGLCCLLPFLSCLKAAEIPLLVEQLPTITDMTRGIQVAFPADEDFPIKCEAKGNPTPVYQWTKNGHPYNPFTDAHVKTRKNSGTFVIHHNGNISSYHGTYRCYASNKLGTAMSEETTFVVPVVPKFPNEDIPPVVAEEGDPVVLHCDPPIGIPPVHIYWMTVDLVQIPQDERVSVGQDGNLYFANVEQTDNRTDYFCFAQFPSIRTMVQKMPMMVTVNTSNSLKERKPKMVTPRGTSSPLTVLKGEVLVLECIAEGLPTPRISWRREGVELPRDRAVTENHANILKVKDASEADHGTYHCVAHNYLGTVQHDFHVHVEEPPRWKKKPGSSVHNVGSSVVLLCSAAGKPDPVIRWKRNGLPLKKEKLPLNHQVMDEEISITNLQLSDSAVFQCEATNKHGTILTSVNINVLDIAPLILTSDNRDYTAVVGQSAFLQCDVFAFPPADISWIRDESVTRLHGARYHIHENGTVEIRETEAQDAGAYTCWVTNARGETALNANLILREPTRVSLSPTNPWVRRSHSVTLTCHVQCDTHLHSSLRISWWKNGQEVTEGSYRIQLQSDTLIIPSVAWEDGGNYNCTAHTSLDSMTAGTHLTVRDVPSPPGELHLSEKQKRSVRLSWVASDSHNSPISEFIIQSEKSWKEPGKWEDLIVCPGNVTSAVLPLTPYLNYHFRVIAVNGIGRSPPSAASEKYSTPPTVPDRNPHIVHAEADKPNEMTVKWEPLRSEEQHGPGLEYRVSWRLQGVDTDWHHERVKGHEFVIKNTPSFVPYDIYVQAVNELGAGPEPHVHTKYSGEDTPDATPLNMAVEVLNSSLVKVSWTGITQDRVRGHLSGYKIIWWKVRSLLDGRKHRSDRHVLVFPGPRDWGMIPGLDPFSEYQMSVVAFNTRGDGPASTAVTFQTPEGVPEQPHFLRILSSDKTSLTLSWGPPRKANGILTSYLLQHQIINDTDEIGALGDINITNPSTVSWRIPKLHASTKYKFYLRACTRAGCGRALSEEGLTVAQARLSAIFSVSSRSPPHLAAKVPLPALAYGEGSQDLSTQGWFIGLMCAVALLTLTLLIACFVQRNKGGKYSVKEKEDLHPEVEVQSMKDGLFGDFSDSDKKPLHGSLDSLSGDMKASDSVDSLVQYGDGDHHPFNEDGSFIGAYTRAKEKTFEDLNGDSAVIHSMHS